MVSVLLDTNVLLDFFEAPRPEHETSRKLLATLQENGVTAYVAGTSLKDVYYIVSRRLNEPAARKAVTSILDTMSIVPIDNVCCRLALNNGEPDFEDGIIRAAAEIAQVDYLISRDARAFAGSRVPHISPADALRELQRH